jgi:hypothetical protein
MTDDASEHLHQLADTLESMVRNANTVVNVLRDGGYQVELFVAPEEETWVPVFGARVRSPDTPGRAAGDWWCGMETPLMSDDRTLLNDAYRRQQKELEAAFNDEAIKRTE